MSITWANVVNIAPELARVPSDAQTQILAQVAAEMDPDVWGTRLDTGAAWLAAHLATLRRRGGSAGPVQSETVGPVSRSFAVQQVASQALESTAYGAEYERQIMTLPGARLALAGC